MKTLQELRDAIDALDTQILSLLNARAQCANEVGELKKREGSAVFRPDREAQVINKLQTLNDTTAGLLKPHSIGNIWREVMSACRALELEAEFLAAIKFSRYSGCRYDKIHATIVELIDHGDETSGRVVRGSVEYRHVRDQHRLELAREAHIIVLTAWPVAQSRELEPNDVLGEPHYWNIAPLNFDGASLDAGSVAKLSEELLQYFRSFAVSAVEIDRSLGQLP
jgi:chorismate mutase-like protein